ncbi:hypothetical protein [Bdellovibrio sp. HCB288]|uniref:hypothetical protein n=1 Tax=Bdellovibrio sp. HCB288 TaxID=3394355 RepID=UPI0039B4EF9E
MKTVLMTLIASSFIFSANNAWALLSTETLPVGISSPSFRYGNLDGISERYTEDGTLVKLGDYKSVNFDAQTLQKFNADAQKLINALNKFGGAKLGDKLNLGVLRVETKPHVNYFAPVFAHGLTEKWTLGIGVPFVTYTNKLSLSQQFSNIDYYRQQFSGINTELDQALATDLGKATNETLAQKGYKKLADQNESFVGDVQLVSVYKFFDNKKTALIYQAQINLPTGPAYDCDNLAALNNFGRTNVNNTVAYSYKISKFTAVPFLSYILNMPDQITERVPSNPDDTLPDATNKETISRQIGNSQIAGGNLFYDVNDQFSLGTGYEYANKEADSFQGSRGLRYDLLSKNTQSNYHKVKAQIIYSTVSSYFKKKSLLPMIASLEISDYAYGVNVERQLAQELNLMLFF